MPSKRDKQKEAVEALQASREGPYSEFPGSVEEWLGEQPEPTKGRKKRRRRRKKKRKPTERPVAETFMEKLKYGAASADRSIIPYSVVPEEFRRSTEMPAPPVGWDPRELTPRERAFAAHLVQSTPMADEERRKNMLLQLMLVEQEEARRRGELPVAGR